MIDNKARYNQIYAKYGQMAFGSVPTNLYLEDWSNKTDASLEDSAYTVLMLLFFPIVSVNFFELLDFYQQPRQMGEKIQISQTFCMSCMAI